MKFQYTTLKSVRDFGINNYVLNDTKTLSLIDYYSSLINRMVSKYFLPKREVKLFNGSGTRVMRVEGLPDIIKINKISTLYPDGSRTLLDASKYTFQGNTIINNFNFPRGYSNIEIDATFGVVSNKKFVEVENLEPINKDSTSIKLNSVEYLEVRDALIIGNNYFIINDIDYIYNDVFVDKNPNIFEIPISTKIECYGAAPIEIERAVNLLIKHNKSLENMVGGRIKKEKTDSYEYELFASQTYTTGIPEVDNILQTFADGEFMLQYL